MCPSIAEEGIPKPQLGHTLIVLRGLTLEGVIMHDEDARKRREGLAEENLKS